MANITLSIDDSLLQAARVRAVKEGTSVNEVCRHAIEQYARRKDDRATRYRELLARIDAAPRPLPRQSPRETRDALYERLLSEKSPKR